MRYRDGGCCLRRISQSVCAFDGDGVNASGFVPAISLGSEQQGEIAGDDPVHRLFTFADRFIARDRDNSTS